MIGFLAPLVQQMGKAIAESLLEPGCLALLDQTQAEGLAGSRRDLRLVMGGRFGSELGGIDRVGASVDQRFVKSVLHESDGHWGPRRDAAGSSHFR